MSDKKKINEEEKLLFEPSVAIYPGETLLEVIQSMGITQTELAKRIGRPLKSVNEIIKGKVAITAETSIQLEKALGKPAAFWGNLESTYQEIIARSEADKDFSVEAKIAKTYPYNEMVKWGWVEKTKVESERVNNLLDYFGVTAFKNIVEEREISGAFRISIKHKHSTPAILAWLRKGVIEGHNTETDDFSKDKLRDAIPGIRKIIFEKTDDFNDQLNRIKGILGECGVALTVTPSLVNAPISGVTRWITPNKVLIQLSIRYRYSDVFWFSFFHEIRHALDVKKDTSVHLVGGVVSNMDKNRERLADKFAADILIPPKEFKELELFLRKKGNYDGIYKIVNDFARRIEIPPGVVLGRLQYEGIIPMTFNKSRERLEWNVSTT